MSRVVFIAGVTPFHAYYLLQHLSTIAGALLLLLAYFHWLRGKRPSYFHWLRGKRPSLSQSSSSGEGWRYLFWLTITIVALLISLPEAVHQSRMVEGYLALRILVFRAGIGFVSIAVPIMILSAVLIDSFRSKLKA